MGIYIEIKKMSEKNNIYRYKVSTGHFNGLEFYIDIDVLKKQVSFYSLLSFSDSIAKIGFEEPDHFKKIPNIDLTISNRVLIQAFKAIEEMNFHDA